MPYKVTLEVFEGPIDLLLSLITRRRVDIYDVSLASITEEYVAAVDHLESLDLEAATGFLVVAATLLELKSARLLPSRSLDPEDASLLEERDLLLARLVECATYREAGAWIAAALEKGAAWHGRSAGLEPQFIGLVPDLLAGTRPPDLAASAARALAPKAAPELDTSHLEPIRATVRGAIVTLSSELADGRDRSFEELCTGVAGKIEVVVRFLALLELFKAGAIDLAQGERFGAIRARWTGEVAAAEAAAGAEEYALEPNGAA